MLVKDNSHVLIGNYYSFSSYELFYTCIRYQEDLIVLCEMKRHTTAVSVSPGRSLRALQIQRAHLPELSCT